MIQFQIDEERCTQCGECAEVCPASVISMNDYPEITNEEGCYRCQHCLAVCPTGAVSVLGIDYDNGALEWFACIQGFPWTGAGLETMFFESQE